MSSYRPNIYKTARINACLSRAEAAYRIGASERALKDYEIGVCRPSDDIVKRMMVVYENYFLGWQHWADGPIGELLLDEMKENDFKGSAIQHHVQTNELCNIQNKLLEIAADGIIDQMEATEWEFIRIKLKSHIVTSAKVSSEMPRRSTEKKERPKQAVGRI